MPKKTPEIGTAHTTDGQEVTFEINNVHDARLDGETVDVISAEDEVEPYTHMAVIVTERTGQSWYAPPGCCFGHEDGLLLLDAMPSHFRDSCTPRMMLIFEASIARVVFQPDDADVPAVFQEPVE